MNLKSFVRSAFVLLFLFWWGTALSQPVLTPQNISMGGGGTAYLTGYEANFINPANLMIPERTTDFSIGVGEIGGFFTPVVSAKSAEQQLIRYKNYLDAYQPGDGSITPEERQQILDRNYPHGRLRSEHQHRLDVILGGIHWQRGDQAFSFTARTRTSTRFEVGRGWYDEKFWEQGNSASNVRDMSLIQQSQLLYEFSFGYAQTFDFVSGMIPRVGRLYIGLAPKFIVGGSYLNLNYDSRYWFTDEMDQPRYTRSFDYHSTGNYSIATEQYAREGNADAAIQRNFPSTFYKDFTEYTKPTGYGAGFDFGLIYVLSLGDDLSLARPDRKQVLDKSLRLGFSVTDIGFVSYNKNPFSIFQAQDTTIAPAASTSESRFEGPPGQYISFFDQVETGFNPLQYQQINGEDNQQKGRFNTILPTSFNAGMLLQVSRLKVSADLTLGLNDSAFNNTKLMGHFGIEFAPIKAIPIRLGTQIASSSPLLWSAGTGVEMKHWELSLGAQFLSKRNSPTLELSGAAFGGFKFHF